MIAPDLTFRIVMVSSDITDDIDDGLELNAEPTVILQGSEDAVKAAAKLFGERVAITCPIPLAEVQALIAAERERCARIVEKRAEDYDRDFGIYDYSTGVTEYPGTGSESMEEWEDIAAAIRAGTEGAA